jgi:hypothetical protein
MYRREVTVEEANDFAAANGLMFLEVSAKQQPETVALVSELFLRAFV